MGPKSKRDSIAWRLSLTIAGITIAAVVVASGILMVYEVVSFRREMARQATVLADLVGTQSVSPLSFGDRDGATEILAALAVDERVLRACLYAADEQPFAHFAPADRGALDVCPPYEADTVRFGLRRMSYYRAILVDGEPVATLFLESDASALLEKVSRSALILLGVLAGAVAISFAIARQLQRAVWVPIQQLILHSRAVSDGDLSRRSEVAERGELGALVTAFSEMSERLRGLADQVRTNTTAVATAIGELRGSSEAIASDARRQAGGVARTSESLQGIGQSVKEINASIEALASEAQRSTEINRETDTAMEGLAKGTDSLSGSIEGNAASIAEMTASMAEISESVRVLQSAAQESGRTLESFSEASQRIREIGAEGHQVSTASMEAARAGLETVSQTIQGMAEVRRSFDEIQGAVLDLSGQLESIREFVGVIDGIAGSTSLLALNARIIAAQAGEHGSAFAVVAHEVAALADQATRSAQEIAGKVQSVGKAANEVVGAVSRGSQRVAAGAEQSNQAGRVLQRICDQSERLQGMVTEVRQTTERQSAAVTEVLGSLGEVLKRVGGIERALGEQAHSTQGISTAAQGLTDLAEQVRNAMLLQRSRSQSMSTSVEGMRAQIAGILAATRRQAAQGDEIDGALRVFREGSDASLARSAALLAIVQTLSARSSQLEREVQRFRT
jgi:methyl-accepting chemotaxis protein